VLFHTLDYVFFLTLVVLLYWGLPRAWRVLLLAASSLFFYGSWNPAYLPVLAVVLGIAWAGGRWLDLWRHYGGHQARRSLILVLLVTPLFFFKYFDWLANSVESGLSHLGLSLGLPRVELPLPVGISFFTFQAMAYVIDVGRAVDKGTPEASDRSPLRFLVYQTWFPQLIAGPIVRAGDILPQLRALPLLRAGDIGAGLFRIGQGLFKKVLIADPVRVAMVDPVFTDPAAFTGLELLVALYAYSLQIYADFSGYSDIAVGSARLFGIVLPENFRSPYKATSVAGFWRRWHITLSDWVRDYVYFPLGGARASEEWKVYRNIFITMVIIGIWHGANWTFVLYGVLHGLASCLNRLRRKSHGRDPDAPPGGAWAFAWRWALTFHFVVLARILFRAEDLGQAADISLALLDLGTLLPRFSPSAWAVLALGYALHFLPDRWTDRAEDWFVSRSPLVWALILAALGAGALAMGTGEHLAFVYYQF
jgi:alginate O-acetyltransferase complex protein AlgI